MHSTGSFNRDYLKVNIKMEEQTVPSAGFSPQPEYMTADYGSSPNYFGVGQQAAAPQQPQHYSYLQQQPHMHPHHHQHQQPNQIGSIGGNGCLDYSNLADSFDLSLLGDSYDDKDMATVPSPSSSAWSPLCGMETSANWQQISFYAASPSSCSDHSRAFSPDCAPAKSPFMSGKEEGISSYSTGAATPELSVAVNSPVEIKIEPEAQQSSTTAQSTSLIRQCLEDNSFLEKYNYKPLDLPILDANQQHQMDGSNGGTTLELNQIEPVFNLAYAQIISDMQNTCRTLAISPDPMQWSVGDVQSWLSYSLSSFSPERGASAIRALWNIDGQRLCSLTEDDFRVRDPLNGEKIFAKLELHKMLKCDGTSGNSSSVPATVPQQAGRDPLASSNNLDLGQILLAASAATSPAPPEISVVDMDMDMEGNHENGGVVSGVVPSLLHSSPASVENFSSSASSSSSMRHSDDEDDEEDEDKPATSSSSSASSPSATSSPSGVKGKASGTKNGAHIHLWQFLKELLASGQQHGSCIRWLDQSHGVFKIEDSVRVARLWGIRKNRPAMNYDKLSRSIRQYYRKGIMKKTERSQRLVYQFCPPYQL